MKSLLITSGSSQLITQLSVLKDKNIDLKNTFLIYMGLFSESLEIFFQQVAIKYGIIYVGQIQFDINPIPLSKREFIRYLFLRKFDRLIELVEHKFALLKDYKNFELLLIPVRVKVLVDIVLLYYLNPKSVIFVADGVIDMLPKRNLTNWKYIYLNNILNSLPLKSNIYSPNFLKRDIKKIGKYTEIDIEEVLTEVSNIGLALKFKEMYLDNPISYVIISQHYHLHEGISLESDILYYKKIINYALKQNKESKVLFKPHPRDVSEKIKNLEFFEASRLLVVNDELKSLPIEIFGKYFIEMNTVFLTGNSSAPLYFKESNDIISICSTENLHLALNDKIKDFADNNNISFINL